MKIQDILTIVEARLRALETSYTLATSSGNLEEALRLETEIEETRITIEGLKNIV